MIMQEQGFWRLFTAVLLGAGVSGASMLVLVGLRAFRRNPAAVILPGVATAILAWWIDYQSEKKGL